MPLRNRNQQGFIRKEQQKSNQLYLLFPVKPKVYTFIFTLVLLCDSGMRHFCSCSRFTLPTLLCNRGTQSCFIWRGGGRRRSPLDFARTQIFERRDHLGHEIRMCSPPPPKTLPKERIHRRKKTSPIRESDVFARGAKTPLISGKKAARTI